MSLDLNVVLDAILDRYDALLSGYQVWPSSGLWIVSLCMLLVYGYFSRWIGLRAGLLVEEKSHATPWQLAVLSLRLLIHPAMVEESIFRGLLLPSPSSLTPAPAIIFWFGVSSLLFILVHPINGIILRPQARAVFSNPVFLMLAGLLGICTSMLYWISASLWPAVLFHWVVVLIWITRYGGATALSGQT